MNRTQKGIVIALVAAVAVVCSGLTYVVARDVLSSQVTSFASGVPPVTASPSLSAVVAVLPTPEPTEQPVRSSTADQAISFVQSFRYDPAQSKTLLDLVNTLQTASQKLGDEIGIEGWQAEKQTANRWVVNYTYREGTRPKTYSFVTDLDTGYIKANNEAGDTLLTFLRQDAQVKEIIPTATPATIYIGWAARDHFTQWDYHVPGTPEQLESIRYAGETLNSEHGFLAVPLLLHNIGKTTKTLRSDYYARFALRDSEGKIAALPDKINFRLPTRWFCRQQGLPEWTEKNVSVKRDQSVTSALVFRLLPNTTSPYTLEITSHDLDTPHRYNIELTHK